MKFSKIELRFPESKLKPAPTKRGSKTILQEQKRGVKRGWKGLKQGRRALGARRENGWN